MNQAENITRGRARGKKSDVFDEAAYRDQLIKIGVDIKAATEVAAKTALAHRKNAKTLKTTPVKSPRAAKVPATSKIPPPKTTALVTRRAETPIKAVYDYRDGGLPERVRDLIQAHLAIEAEDAKSAGTLGFMTRALAIATLPHRKLAEDRFVRKNGDFTLTMLTTHPEGLPYGTLPRLLLTWVTTEVVQRKERVLSLARIFHDQRWQG